MLLKQLYRAFLFPFLLLISSLNAQIIPSYTVLTTKKSPAGYYLFVALPTNTTVSQINRLFIMNGKGHVVYMRPFPSTEFAGDFKVQKKGVLSYNDNRTKKTYLLNDSLITIDSAACTGSIVHDYHDFHVLPSGEMLMIGIINERADLSASKNFKNKCAGSRNAKMKNWAIVRQSALRDQIFVWKSNDLYTMDDADAFYMTDSADVDMAHFNSVTVDTDGNYLLSARNFNEVTKISPAGTVMWRWGGSKNEFRFLNDTIGFLAQHAVIRAANGNILLYDNGRQGTKPHPAIAKEYKLDEKKKTATLMWQYTENPASFCLGYGNVQRLDQWNTLINYGRTPLSPILFNVVTRRGEKIFEIAFKDSLRSFRTFFYKDLSFSFKRPTVTCLSDKDGYYLQADAGYESYQWSTFENGQTIRIQKPGAYFVTVPYKDAYITSEPWIISDLRQMCVPKKAK